jgi:hypothetical protein
MKVLNTLAYEAYEARVFNTFIHFHPRLILVGKDGAYHSGAPFRLPL